MKRVMFILLTMIMFFSVCSCKPTPKEPIVVSKADGKLEKIIYGEAAPQTDYNFPTEWKTEIEPFTDDVTITVDAKVTTPNVKLYPVYHARVAAAMTQEYADMIMDYFIGKEEQLYDPTRPPKSKQEIMKEIIEREEYINDPNSEFNTTIKQSMSESEFLECLEGKKRYIKQLEDEYAVAPEKSEWKKVGREFVEYRDENGNLLNYFIRGLTKDDEGGYDHGTCIQLQKDLREGNNYKRAVTVGVGKNGGIFMYPDVILDNCDNLDKHGMKNYTYEQAEALAQELLHRFGKTNYEVAFPCSCSTYWFEKGVLGSWYELPRGYYFYYTQVIDGIPVLLEFDSVAQSNNSYRPEWPRENVAVAVSNDGICYYYEYSSLDAYEKLNNNVPLLSFDKIQNIFKQYVSMKLSYFDTHYNQQNVMLPLTTFALATCVFQRRDSRTRGI